MFREITRIPRRVWSSRHRAVRAAIYWSGIGRTIEIATRPTGAIILMYHSIAAQDAARFIDPQNRISPELFQRQMAFLRRYRRVVPLSQLVSDIACGISPPAGTVCITFDDGYLDNLTIAAPILSQYGLPATLYLATGYIGRCQSQWADVLYWLLTARTANVISLPSLGVEKVPLDQPALLRDIRRVLHKRLLEAEYDERSLLLAELQQQLRPKGKPPRLTLNWDEVRELCDRFPLIQIGGHTQNHIDLQTHSDMSATLEITGCAEDLKRELGVDKAHFSFPYGRHCKATREIVRLGGWLSAVGDGDSNRIGPVSDRYAMPRFDAPRTMTDLRFMTSGVACSKLIKSSGYDAGYDSD